MGENASMNEISHLPLAQDEALVSLAVAAFCMILRNSPYCQISLATVRDWAKASKSGDEDGWRAECVQLIEKAMLL